MKKGNLLSLVGGLIFLGSCASPPLPSSYPPQPQSGFRLTAVDFYQLPGWEEDNHAEIIPALKESCLVTRAMWCREIDKAGDGQKVKQFVESNFQPFKVNNNGEAKGTFTGYYQVETKGSLKKTNSHQVPLLGIPSDLVEVNKVIGRYENGNFKPYFTRAEIESGILKDKAKEIIWLNDPIEAHMLHVQGSGMIKLDNGQTIKVGFAQSNGLPFKGITRILIEKGKLEPNQLSMLATRDWLRKNPKEAKKLMAENPRYIFFRKIEDNDSRAIGAAGIPLTFKRSIAVDNQYIPLHSLLWLNSKDAEGNNLQRLMVAQDTGSAIKGVVRGDFFWGRGEAAFQKAAGMKSVGEYYILKPKDF